MRRHWLDVLIRVLLLFKRLLHLNILSGLRRLSLRRLLLPLLSNARRFRFEAHDSWTWAAGLAAAASATIPSCKRLLLALRISLPDFQASRISVLVLGVHCRWPGLKLCTFFVGVSAFMLAWESSYCNRIIVHGLLDSRDRVALLLLVDVKLERRTSEQVRRVAPGVTSPLAGLRLASALVCRRRHRLATLLPSRPLA